jgi:hypothetical protein
VLALADGIYGLTARDAIADVGCGATGFSDQK